MPAEQLPTGRERQFTSGVVENAYRHVIENAISGVENLPAEAAVDYLRAEWLPYALSCQKAWTEGDRMRESGDR